MLLLRIHRALGVKNSPVQRHPHPSVGSETPCRSAALPDDVLQHFRLLSLIQPSLAQGPDPCGTLPLDLLSLKGLHQSAQ